MFSAVPLLGVGEVQCEDSRPLGTIRIRRLECFFPCGSKVRDVSSIQGLVVALTIKDASAIEDIQELGLASVVDEFSLALDIHIRAMVTACAEREAITARKALSAVPLQIGLGATGFHFRWFRKTKIPAQLLHLFFRYWNRWPGSFLSALRFRVVGLRDRLPLFVRLPPSLFLVSLYL